MRDEWEEEDSESEDFDMLDASTSSMDKFRHLWNKPDVTTAAGALPPYTPKSNSQLLPLLKFSHNKFDS